MTIDASEAPHLVTTGVPAAFSGTETPCFSSWARGLTMMCLLPPSAALSDVSIGGTCGGCGACKAPAGAFVKATTSDVDAWSDKATATITTTLPSHDKSMIATRFQVRATGAEFIQAKLTVMSKSATVFNEEQSCTFDAMTGVTGVCTFLIYDTVATGAVSVTAEATGWGACPSAGCSSPKTLKIDSLSVLL